MASADVRDELDCSICLNIYTDPVMLRCGHNYCRACIDQVLFTQNGCRVYSCPECRAEFLERPALMRNIALCNIVRNFLPTEPRQEEITGICCTYCIHAPVPAVKSCLHCEASLCDNHVRVHNKAAEHVLTEPSTSLENKKCSVHMKILEYYCIEDAACICVSCSLVGEHRGHRVEMLDEASAKKKKKLRNVLQKLTTKREETEERVQSLEDRWRKDQEKAAGEAERVTALFTDLRRRLDDLEKRVLSEISRQEEEQSLSLSALIQQLEIKKDELSGKMRHIEELCNMTDPLTVLQGPDTCDLCDPEEGGGDEDTGRRDKQLHDLDLGFISDIIHAGLLDIVNKAKSSLEFGSSKKKMFADHGIDNSKFIPFGFPQIERLIDGNGPVPVLPNPGVNQNTDNSKHGFGSFIEASYVDVKKDDVKLPKFKFPTIVPYTEATKVKNEVAAPGVGSPRYNFPTYKLTHDRYQNIDNSKLPLGSAIFATYARKEDAKPASTNNKNFMPNFKGFRLRSDSNRNNSKSGFGASTEATNVKKDNL
ncbi:E3 ubiquitin/ISG15 ligase TRIM25-like [Rhinoderma darwinii]|uniref:E3 ubiquitin/ISG15 ligase TRIM25-like n=1 Tax=Rhinoderma darwinii TaxID=43563 RepID=UPI003F67258C